MSEKIIAAPYRSQAAISEFLSNSAKMLEFTPDIQQELSETIRYDVDAAKSKLANVEHFKGRAKLLQERSDESPIERFVAAAAIRQFLADYRLLDRFDSQLAYCPFTKPELHPDPTDADIWCVEITPATSRVRLNYKYAPGQNGEGWEFALLAVHRESDRQWVLPPEDLARLHALTIFD